MSNKLTLTHQLKIMKKIISILIVLVSLTNYSQTEVHNQKVKLKTTPQGSKSDSLIVKGVDNILKYLSRTDFLEGTTDGNDFLTSISEASGLLTFNVSNQTNPTFNLDSYLATKPYLTAHQDLSSYLTFAQANSSYEPIKGTDDNFVTDAEKIVIGNTSGTNTGDQDLSGYALSTDLFSGSYLDLTDQPTIPINNNQLTNGAGYLVAEQDNFQTVTNRGNNTTNDVVIDPLGTNTNIAGSLLTIKKESTVASTDVLEFKDVNRNNTITGTGTTIGSVVRVQNNSSVDNEGIKGNEVVSRHLGTGNVNYIYGSASKADYSGSGNIGFLVPQVGSAEVTGTGTGTINYIRANSNKVLVNNPNVTVNYAQGSHPTLSFEKGRIKNSQILVLDYDINADNLDTSLFLDEDLTYLQGGGGADVASVKTYLENKGKKLRFIHNLGTSESDFNGLINYLGDVSNYNTASNKALVNLEKLNQQTTILQNQIDDFSSGGSSASSYTVITGLVTQLGSTLPTVIIHENTTGATLSNTTLIGGGSAGFRLIFSQPIFIEDDTWYNLSNNFENNPSRILRMNRENTTSFYFRGFNNGTSNAGLFDKVPFEIRVYYQQ